VEPNHDNTEHHMHHFEDECVYVLNGTATAYTGEQSQIISAGDFIGYGNGGVAHSITNTGTETFRCIVVGERLAHEVGDHTRLGKRIYRNESVTWNLVDHGHVVEVGGGVGKK
jgi:uncharacterized cupin superfamily protein